MSYVICVLVGIVLGAGASFVFDSQIHAKLDSLHGKFDELLARVKAKL
jgi:hypothetical protein